MLGDIAQGFREVKSKESGYWLTMMCQPSVFLQLGHLDWEESQDDCLVTLP